MNNVVHLLQQPLPTLAEGCGGPSTGMQGDLRRARRARLSRCGLLLPVAACGGGGGGGDAAAQPAGLVGSAATLLWAVSLKSLPNCHPAPAA